MEYEGRLLCEVIGCNETGESAGDLSQWPTNQGAKLCAMHHEGAREADKNGRLFNWIMNYVVY